MKILLTNPQPSVRAFKDLKATLQIFKKTEHGGFILVDSVKTQKTQKKSANKLCSHLITNFVHPAGCSSRLSSPVLIDFVRFSSGFGSPLPTYLTFVLNLHAYKSAALRPPLQALT